MSGGKVMFSARLHHIRFALAVLGLSMATSCGRKAPDALPPPPVEATPPPTPGSTSGSQGSGPPPLPLLRHLRSAPLASASTQFEHRCTARSLGEAEAALLKKLDESGHHGRSLWKVDGGFAIATRFESIGADGRPLPEPGRWVTGPISPNWWSVWFGQPVKGRYRAFLFVVGNNIPQSEALTFDALEGLIQDDAYNLPSVVARERLSADTRLRIFVYEYERRVAGDTQLHQLTPGLGVATHLTGAKLHHLQRGLCR